MPIWQIGRLKGLNTIQTDNHRKTVKMVRSVLFLLWFERILATLTIPPSQGYQKKLYFFSGVQYPKATSLPCPQLTCCN